jgi:hypothetical protein
LARPMRSGARQQYAYPASNVPSTNRDLFPRCLAPPAQDTGEHLAAYATPGHRLSHMPHFARCGIISGHVGGTPQTGGSALEPALSDFVAGCYTYRDDQSLKRRGSGKRPTLAR